MMVCKKDKIIPPCFNLTRMRHHFCTVSFAIIFHSFFFSITATAQSNLLWGFGLGNPSDETITAATTDQHNNYFVTGVFTGTQDFDPGYDTTFLTADGASDAFVAKYDWAGNLVWVKKFSGPYSFEHPLSLTVNPSGAVIICGFFLDDVDFDPGPAVFTLTSTIDQMFVCKLDSNGGFLWANGYCVAANIS